MNAGLILRTVEHLRWEQLIYRPIRLVQSQLDRTVLSRHWASRSAARTATRSSAEIVGSVVGSLPHLNQPLSLFDKRVSDLNDHRFTFLNRSLTLDPLNWSERYESHLWNYNLHYFAYSLWCARAYLERQDERALQTIRGLISQWISETRPGVGDGWDAYPLSLRIVNWTLAYSLIAPRSGDDKFLTLWSSSIHRQLEFLSHHVEYHLLANHIIKNARALIIGGLLFGEAKWISSGRALLLRELDEQVLDDGGHFERAPMYHAQVLADAIESLVMLKAFDQASEVQIGTIEAKVAAMARFLSATTYRDGTLALFNDSANLEELAPGPIVASASQMVGLPGEVGAFPTTGYYLWTSSDDSERLIVDAGPPAADYNTAHAHCDLLSYELWLKESPFVVDSGVHGYEGDRFREYSRSTRAHNTVVFDEREQSEVWATFRMGARARVVSAQVTDEGDTWRFHGAYTPYFDRSLIHQRTIERRDNGEWLFVDKVNGGDVQQVESFIHLHPDVRASKLEDSRISCDFAGGRAWIEPFGIDNVEVVKGVEAPMQGWYFPDFGVARPNPTICMRTKIVPGQEFGYTIRVE